MGFILDSRPRVYWIVSYIFNSNLARHGLVLTLALTAGLSLSACAPWQPAPASPSLLSAGTLTHAVPDRLQTLLSAEAPTHVILLGEQHDNPDHQRIGRDVVVVLAAQGRLAALVVEMVAQGQSTAPNLPATTSENEVKAALQWDDKAWSWEAYGPVVMAAVKAGVPVLGANLPRAQMRSAMADAALDARLDAAALQSQRQAIREGHCGLLPESQIGPMTRVQIGRDVAMAQVIAQEVAKVAAFAENRATNPNAHAPPGQRPNASAAPPPPPKIVLLIAGSGHVDAALGVPRHWPAGVWSRSVLLHGVTQTTPNSTAGKFDAVWPTQAIEAKDYCADLKKPIGR